MFSKREEDADVTAIEIIGNPEQWHWTILEAQKSDATCAEIVLNFRERYFVKDLEDWLEGWKNQRDNHDWIPTVPPIDDVIQAAETLLVYFKTDLATAVEQVKNDKPH